MDVLNVFVLPLHRIGIGLTHNTTFLIVQFHRKQSAITVGPIQQLKGGNTLEIHFNVLRAQTYH